MKWQKILLGRLATRACRSSRPKAGTSGCDCGPEGRCPLQSYCAAARLEATTGARLERWFWKVILGGSVGLGLYALLIRK